MEDGTADCEQDGGCKCQRVEKKISMQSLFSYQYAMSPYLFARQQPKEGTVPDNGCELTLPEAYAEEKKCHFDDPKRNGPGWLVGNSCASNITVKECGQWEDRNAPM
jgi:hypothetical protein